LNQDPADLKRYFSRVSLGFVLRHFDRMEDAIEEVVNPKERGARVQADLAHSFNAGHAVLRTCAFVEEELTLMWRIKSGPAAPPGSGNILKKSKPILRSLGLDLGSREWQDLQSGFLVRRCLLHANGRVDLMRQPKDRSALEALASGSPERLKLKRLRIEVGREFVLDTINAAGWLIEGTSRVRRDGAGGGG
jgi:hypothetical protein